jgi:hypothetical protein
MGVVWEVPDAEVGRQVALKRLRPEFESRPDLRERFLAEARITGQLEHPGVVPVYRVIEQPDGSPAYVMRLISGETLHEAVRTYHELPGRLALCELLRCFVSVCQTLAYAHSRGGIHRDLKGENVMLGPYGEVLVLDWGLARVCGADVDGSGIQPLSHGRPEATGAGAALGTPAYMAPEQARGEQTDARSDVFGLGALLYLILTGRPPHDSPSAIGTVLLAREGKVTPPRRLAPDVPRALETICLKALAPEPSDRYQSAAELAVEVKRWLAGEPLDAGRERLVVRAGFWRGKLGLGLSAALLLAALVAAGWFARLWVEGRRPTAGRESEPPGDRHDQPEVIRQVRGAEPPADGRRDQAAENPQTEESDRPSRSSAVAWSPDGSAALGCSDGTVRVHDERTGRRRMTLKGHTAEVLGVAYSRDGSRIVSGSADYTVRVWDARTGKNLLTLEVHPEGVQKGQTDGVRAVAFSPDGSRIASGSRDGNLRLWDARTGRRLATLEDRSMTSCVVFSPDGSRLASGSYFGPVRVWDARTGRALLTIEGHAGAVLSVAFSPDGSRVASGGTDRTVKVWDARTGRDLLTLEGHTGRVRAVAFSPDGSRLASGGHGGTVRVHDAGTGKSLWVLKGRGNSVYGVAYSQDGARLVSDNGEWDGRTGQGLSPER